MAAARRFVPVGVAAVTLLAGLSASANAATTTNPFGGLTGLQPWGLAVDAAGNVYTANAGSKSVTRISADGTTTGQFGGMTGTTPQGIAVDSKGNVYTSNTGSDTVTRIAPDGFTAQFGGTTGDGPRSIALDSNDNVYTLNVSAWTVTRISAGGSSTAQFGGQVGGTPLDLALDSKGNVYTANSFGKSVTRIAANGASTTTFATFGSQPAAIAVDAKDNVYVVTNDRKVTRLAAGTGTPSPFGGSTGASPADLVFDEDGNLYVSNYSDSSITRISADGSRTEQYGGTTGSNPNQMAFDAAGRLFVSNSGSNTVTRISPDRGPLTFSAGGFGPATVGVSRPLTVTVTNTGDGSVRPTGISTTGPGVTVIGGTCTVGTRIQPGASCTVALRWTPSATGPLTNGSLRITYPNGVTPGNTVGLSGTAAPKPVTTLAVTAKPKAQRLRVDKRTVVVRKVVSDGTVRTKAWCSLRNKRLPANAQRRLCQVQVTDATTQQVRVSAKPTCSTRLTVHARVTATRPGATTSTWTRAWRIDNSPTRRCRR